MLAFWRITMLSLMWLPCATYAEERPNFIISTDRFDMIQDGAYDLGLSEKPLNEEEIIRQFHEKPRSFSTSYHVEYKKYVRWLLIVDNISGRSQKMVMSSIFKFENFQMWLVQDGRLVSFKHFPTPYVAASIEIPSGRSFIAIQRPTLSNAELRTTSLRIQDWETFIRDRTLEDHFIAGTGGFVIFMVLYNLSRFISSRRERHYIYHSIYAIGCFYCLTVGIGYSTADIRWLAIGLFVTIVALLKFYNSALSLKIVEPKLERISNFLIAYFAFITIWAIFDPMPRMVTWCIPLIAFYCFFIAIKRSRSGHRSAVYLVLGWVAFLLSTNIAALNLILNGKNFAGILGMSGLIAELCFFALAAAEKRRSEEQKSSQDLEHAFSQLRKVFYPHQITQIKAGVELEKTMPTHSAEAVVLKLQIMSNAKIEPLLRRQAMHDAIKSCLDRIGHNYNSTLLESDAYRIKEFADCFLCSVAYPFATVNGKGKEESAFDLALELSEIVERESQKIIPDKPLFCSVGLAEGRLEGSYPVVGALEYDVSGRAIVLATRYEAMNSILFPKETNGHVIVMSSKVYEGLTRGQRNLLTRVDLKKNNINVRDDIDASELYYKIIKAKVQKLSKSS